jgi:general secretion pathway protein G
MKEHSFQAELSEASLRLLAGDTVENEYCVCSAPYSQYAVEIVKVKECIGCIEIENHPLSPDNVKAVITQDDRILPLVNMSGTKSPVAKEQAKVTRGGFTLVEILIVVVILGVLAAIVIPQFSNAADGARDSALAKNLQVVRQQLELYKLEHQDAYPAIFTGPASQLTNKTYEDGTIDSEGDCGPYIQKMPSNPFNNKATVQVETGTGGRGDGSHGWHFDSSTGNFTADDAEHSDL